ncbi:transposase [Ruegeria sp. 1NDH52C]|uniref:Transposase n=1 Tax=Ruegeria alba TaxID=2916756 RepID=A0ABS9P0B5_9RHOB|nr:transposase [Ruegeria alba]
MDVVANTEARRQIIGLGVGPSEAETFRMDFMSGLNAWGLDVMKLVISDAHSQESRLSMNSGHLGNHTILADATNQTSEASFTACIGIEDRNFGGA